MAASVAASVGELDAVAPRFAPALDVPNWGVLCALPALLAVGLLEGVKRYLTLPKGYYGQTQPPRHYVARQRLCLRATTDYWVNAMDGQPFFVVNQAVDPGLIQVIEHQIVPRAGSTVEALSALIRQRPVTQILFDCCNFLPPGEVQKVRTLGEGAPYVVEATALVGGRGSDVEAEDHSAVVARAGIDGWTSERRDAIPEPD